MSEISETNSDWRRIDNRQMLDGDPSESDSDTVTSEQIKSQIRERDKEMLDEIERLSRNIPIEQLWGKPNRINPAYNNDMERVEFMLNSSASDSIDSDEAERMRQKKFQLMETMTQFKKRLNRNQFMSISEIDDEKEEMLEQSKDKAYRYAKYQKLFNCKSNKEQNRIYVPEKPPRVEGRFVYDKGGNKIAETRIKMYLKETIEFIYRNKGKLPSGILREVAEANSHWKTQNKDKVEKKISLELNISGKSEQTERACASEAKTHARPVKSSKHIKNIKKLNRYRKNREKIKETLEENIKFDQSKKISLQEEKTDCACASDAKAQARPVRYSRHVKNIEQSNRYKNKRKIDETFVINNDNCDKTNRNDRKQKDRQKRQMTDRPNVRNPTNLVETVNNEKINEKIKKLHEITITPIKQGLYVNKPLESVTSNRTNNRSSHERCYIADRKSILEEKKLNKPISEKDQSRSGDCNAITRRHNNNIASDETVSSRRASLASRCDESRVDLNAKQSETSAKDSDISSTVSVRVRRSIEEDFDTIIKWIEKLNNKMSSDRESTSSTDSDDYRRVENKLNELQMTLAKVERKKKLRQQEKEIEEIQSQLKRKISSKKNRDNSKVDQFARKIEELKKQKDKILMKKENKFTIRHNDEAEDEKGEWIGDFKFEAEIKKGKQKNEEIKVTYKIKGRNVTRSVEINENANKRSAEEKPIQNEEEMKRNQKEKKEKMKRKYHIETTDPQPSTSREDPSAEPTGQMIEFTGLMEESSEDGDEQDIGTTRDRPIKRRRLSESEEEKTTKKPMRNRKGKIIYNKKRSEIAKKNYVNQTRSVDGKWSHKKEQILKTQPRVLLSRVDDPENRKTKQSSKQTEVSAAIPIREAEQEQDTQTEQPSQQEATTNEVDGSMLAEEAIPRITSNIIISEEAMREIIGQDAHTRKESSLTNEQLEKILEVVKLFQEQKAKIQQINKQTPDIPQEEQTEIMAQEKTT